jgi:hypothetical protein
MLLYRRLKSTAQLCKIFPLEPGFTVHAQSLLENFYKANKLPNDDERDILQLWLQVDAEAVDAWRKDIRAFVVLRHRRLILMPTVAMKSFRLRAYRAVIRRHVKPFVRGFRQWISHTEDLDFRSHDSSTRYDSSKPEVEKPYTRH